MKKLPVVNYETDPQFIEDILSFIRNPNLPFQYRDASAYYSTYSSNPIATSPPSVSQITGQTLHPITGQSSGQITGSQTLYPITGHTLYPLSNQTQALTQTQHYDILMHRTFKRVVTASCMYSIHPVGILFMCKSFCAKDPASLNILSYVETVFEEHLSNLDGLLQSVTVSGNKLTVLLPFAIQRNLEPDDSYAPFYNQFGGRIVNSNLAGIRQFIVL